MPLRPLQSADAPASGSSDLAADPASGPTSGSSSEGSGSVERAPTGCVPTGWSAVDAALTDRGERGRGLARHGVHEWFGTSFEGAAAGRAAPSRRDADHAPPLLLLAHLAARAVEDALERGAPAHVLWIGRRVWPYPRTLVDGSRLVECDGAEDAEGGADLLRGGLLRTDLALDERAAHANARSALVERSLFVDPPDDGQRLWTIDAALRCPDVTAVVADGARLGMAATRRLQLAASGANGRGALALLARPPSELGEISAAATRWVIARAPARGHAPRWRARLLRVKGAQLFRGARTARAPGNAWAVRGGSALDLAALVDRTTARGVG
ncbi:MAG: hypothetical protein AAFU73_17410 [Planctomycetota bacterium]